MSAGPGSVLIVRLSSIGDVVHTIPAYMALVDSWPEARFGWAVERAAADLVRRLPGRLSVHELDIQDWRRRATQPSAVRQAWQAISRLRAPGYRLALDFQGLLKSAVVARLSGAEVLGFASEDARERLATGLHHRHATQVPTGSHIIRHNLHLAAAAGATIDDARYPDLAGAEARELVGNKLTAMGVAGYVVMHATASWSSKRLPPEPLIAAARQVHAVSQRTVVWVWGPGEQQRIATLADAAGAGSVAAPPLRLPQLAAIIQGADLFIGGDSAPLHLAVASNTPTVAVFGPTDPARLGPTNPDDEIICHRLTCSHCHKRLCPLGSNECLEGVSADELTAAALARLGASRVGRVDTISS